MSQGKEFTKAGGMSFDKWWEVLKWEASVRAVAWLLSTQEDYREGYDGDYTPEEELGEQMDAAAQDACDDE
jgi:hypothetical protein